MNLKTGEHLVMTQARALIVSHATYALVLSCIKMNNLPQILYMIVSNCCSIGGAVVQRIERWTLRSIDRWVQFLLEATLHNNLGQVVYTYMPLPSSSITWYRPKGGDALQLGRQPQAWRKVMAAYRRVDDLRSPAG